MDAHRIASAEACLRGAHNGTMSFPEILGELSGTGFEGYLVDYRRGTTTYYLADGDSIVLDNPGRHGGPVAEVFDAEGVAARIRWAQSGAPDYSYAAFCEQVTALGCVGYLVSIPGRRVLYVGRTAEVHVEHFPPPQAPSDALRAGSGTPRDP